MSVKVGINGFGRIGRQLLRIAEQRGIDVVAVNDLTDTATLAHLLKHDSTYGRYPGSVAADTDALVVDGKRVAVSAIRDPHQLDWSAYGADIVVESTGKFRARDEAALHLAAGARKVILSAPGKSPDITIVMGVNDGDYDPAKHDIISNASCTTNCVTPMVKVLDEAFGIDKGFLTTVHGYTNDQNVLDGPHKDLRRARTAGTNIIPTSTGAAKTTGQVIASLSGKLDGVAVRVPVEDGSLTDLTVLLNRDATAEEINQAFAAAAGQQLKGILRYSDEPLVSRDVIGDDASCIFDAGLTQANGRLAKVFGWYDNEYGYTCRLADLVALVGAHLT